MVVTMKNAIFWDSATSQKTAFLIEKLLCGLYHTKGKQVISSSKTLFLFSYTSRIVRFVSQSTVLDQNVIYELLDDRR
jgi:hypothetical protein